MSTARILKEYRQSLVENGYQIGVQRELPLLYLTRDVLRIAGEHQWGAKDVSIFSRLSDGLLKELCETPCRCYGKKEKSILRCHKCSGTTLFSASNAWRARQLGISGPSFALTWAPRWEILKSQISEQHIMLT